MKPPLPRILTDVPRTLQAQLEVAKAIRTIIGPHEDELLQERSAEIAALRRDLEALARDIPKAFEAAAALAKAELQAALKERSATAKRDVQDNLKGYDLYESARIRPSRQ